MDRSEARKSHLHGSFLCALLLSRRAFALLVAVVLLANICVTVLLPASPASAVSSWASISTGATNACALTSTGAAYCWGDNGLGQLGDGTTTSRLAPVPVSGGLLFSSISVGAGHACGITTSSAAYCWGYNAYGGLGDNTTVDKLVPTAVNGGGTWIAIAAGLDYSCGVKTGGTAYCWGKNDKGQVGDNTVVNKSIPTAVNGGRTYSTVTTGNTHSCGLVAGIAYCWGANASGGLGDNTTVDKLIPTVANGGIVFSSISAGMNNQTCAIRTSNSFGYCWGANSSGQLGDNTTVNKSIPTVINGSVTLSSIKTGASHSCAVSTGGTGYCWGSNFYGQVGDATITNKSVPTAIASLTFSSIVTGDHYSCGKLTNNQARCWGQSYSGEMGDGTLGTHHAPYPLSNSVGLVSVSSSMSGYHSCGLTSGGTAYCWGENGSGQLGDNTTTDRATPTAVSAGFTFSAIAVGVTHTCGIRASNGAMYCWGSNAFGQIGDNTGVDKLVPTATLGGLSYTAISAGAYHSCAITSTNTGRCWGSGVTGEIGNNGSANVGTPTAPNGSYTFSKISAGFKYSCGIRSDTSTALCWGTGTSGQLGDNTSVSKAIPTAVNGGATYSNITTSSGTTCAIRATGSAAYCWGTGTSGQLGDNTSVSKLVPTAVSGGLAFSSISAGGFGNCGITTSNAAYCWGLKSQGQSGDGVMSDIRDATTTTLLVPTAVTGGLSFASISSGYVYTCGVTVTTPVLYCWGTSQVGAMADGSAVHYVPLPVDWPPETPTTLTQLKAAVTIATGGWTNATSVNLQAYLSDTDATDTNQLCVEIQPLATSFTNLDTSCGSSGTQANTFQNAQTVANGVTYHWQARSRDADGGYSPWVQFNSGTAAFTVDTVAPGAPTTLVQYKSNGTTVHTTGAWTNDTTIISKATVTDNAAPVAVCVEFQPIGTSFLNTDTACGSTVTSGSIASASYVAPQSQMHWQARSLDAAGNYSSWSPYGGNAETVRDVGVDTAAPTGGTVFDGSTVGMDASFNNGSLSALSANWSGFTDSLSGVASYEYAIGTTSGATDVRAWTANAASTSVTASGLTLKTSQMYYFSVRATDNAANVSSVVTSDGMAVSPTFTFTVAGSLVDLGRLNAANSYTSSTSLNMTVSTNAYSGYVVRQYASSALTSQSAATVAAYSGVYPSPTVWTGTGLGYTSADTTIQSSGDIFGSGTKYARLATSGPGDIVADHTPTVSGTPITGESQTLTYKIVSSPAQAAGTYQTSIILGATAIF